MKKKSIISISIVLICLLLSGLIYFYNYFTLQKDLNKVLDKDYRNNGISVSVHYANYFEINTVEYNLKEFKGSNTPADIFRILLQFAESRRDRDFGEVRLCYN